MLSSVLGKIHLNSNQIQNTKYKCKNCYKILFEILFTNVFEIQNTKIHLCI